MPPGPPAHEAAGPGLRSAPGGAGGRGRADCLECRVTGTAVCLGAAAYLVHGARTAPALRGPGLPRAATLGLAGAFAALGMLRAAV